MNSPYESCPGCKASFPDTDSGKPHPYIGASSGCWNIYGGILAREFEDQDYFKLHRITVDSYAAQHIGDQTDRRARQSANLHLIALYLYFEKMADTNLILKFLTKATEHKRDWPTILEPEDPQWLTPNDIILATTAQEHVTLVAQWGQSIWDAYKKQHANIIKTYENFMQR